MITHNVYIVTSDKGEDYLVPGEVIDCNEQVLWPEFRPSEVTGNPKSFRWCPNWWVWVGRQWHGPLRTKKEALLYEHRHSAGDSK